MSRLRARCPACETLTVVAVSSRYECHVCGHVFAAGLVRVPRAWGVGGEAMADAAALELPYPETGSIEEDTLAAQSLALAAALPERPLVLGGCCCAHIGAVEGLSVRRDGPLAVVWLDAHGDLNTPESSPSGNLWGMPLRMLLDDGAVAPGNVALIGARNLDQPEEEFIATSGLRVGAEGVAAALEGAERVYVALDCDSLDPSAIACFMPESGGLSLEAAEQVLREVAARAAVVGVGVTGLLPDPANVAPVARLLAALGL